MADTLRLAVLTFPQRWNPATATLDVNVVLVPSVSPVDGPLLGPGTPDFADHVPALRACVIPSLSETPFSNDPTIVHLTPKIVEPAAPAPSRPNFLKLVAAAAASKNPATITGTGALTSPSQATIRKALPQSYLNATGASASGATATTDEFACAINGQTVVTSVPKPTTIGWGPVISYALRQPKLASQLGLRYVTQIVLPSATLLGSGGWVFFDFAPGDPWAAGAAPPNAPVRLYAGRLPLLTKARQIFSAVLFPVDATAPIDDNAAIVADTYDDGFAQIVHTFQPLQNDAVLGDASVLPAPTDIGVQIGWDDEQVVAWQNNQIAILNQRMSGALDAQTPLGVLGYRVDVADITTSPTPAWHSLVRKKVTLPHGFGTFEGELVVEPTPVGPAPTSSSAPPVASWLPRYFANWHGGSLVTADPVLPAMLAKVPTPLTATPDPIGVLLAYGRSYAFRVRLADLSSGGPERHDAPVNLDPADVSTIDFLRTVPPKAPGIAVNVPAGGSPLEPQSLTFTRPLIGYPEALFTGLGATDADRGKIVEYLTSIARPGTGVVAGVPDPDAATLQIAVEVRTPAHDVAGAGTLDGPFRLLYTTTRKFPALPPGPVPVDPGLTLEIAYVDAPSIVDWAPTQPASGPLVVPRARDVRITARALTPYDPAYFAASATTGLIATIAVRAELRAEPSLLIAPVDGSPTVRALLFNRPAGIDAPAVADQLASELGLVADGLTLSAPPGTRIAFGASKSIRHALPGDNSTITFAAESELLRQWVVAIVLDLERDWTWDGLGSLVTTNGRTVRGTPSVSVARDGAPVGTLTVPGTLGPAATADPANWDRRRTLLVFFDGVDPHETTPSGFPQELPHAWTLAAQTIVETTPVVGTTGAPTLVPTAVPEPPVPEQNGVAQALVLPISIPPTQIPALASVGLALTPFTAGDGYASTSARSRSLWVELTQPLANPAGDAVFARVLAHGADPLLYEATPSQATVQPVEPPLAIDPELIRTITAASSDDRSGLSAMTMLEPASDSNVHFLLPLPPGVDPSDPDLFGFYTYEFRIGHAGDPHANLWWSTAQGRFGRPLRVSGVQHPAPPLVCNAGRLRETLAAPSIPDVPPDLASVVQNDLVALRARATVLPAHDVARLATYVLATATYATPVLNGRPLVGPDQTPKTTLAFFLYAQVVQADAASNRNVLLFQRAGTFFGINDRLRFNETATVRSQRDRIGGAIFTESEIEAALTALGLPVTLPLSVLAVEFLPGGVGNDLPNPLGVAARAADAAIERDGDPLDLAGRPRRILRASPLVPVAAVC
jgi:hypothetical protein